MPQHLAKESDMAFEAKMLKELAQGNTAPLLSLPVEP
jgi:hypothetical protein